MSDETPVPGELAIGDHLAGYRLDGIIARGGMAVVYRAFDERLGRSVALKVLAAPLARDLAFRRRFIRESRIAAAVDHPNIVPIFEAGEADGVLFIAMRLVPGRDVQSLIEQQGPLPTGRACHIVTQVAAALDAAHEQGLVHRDVKPANMLRDAAAGEDYPDHVYLSDFGLSKHGRSTSQLTSYGEFLGTMDYVSPEQIEGHPVDGRSDQYALACSAFEMLTGAPPFKQDETLAIMWAQVSTTPPTLTSRRPDLPAAADPVLAKALAKAPGDRYDSCREFASALRRACGLGGAPAAPIPAQPDPATADEPPPVPPPVPPPPPAQVPLAQVPLAQVPLPAQAPPPVTATPAAPAAPVTAAPVTPARHPAPLAPPAYRMSPGRVPGSRRSRTAVLVACVALLGVIGGGYLMFGGGSGAGTRPLTPLAVPGCTTKAATAETVAGVPAYLVRTGEKPFDVVVTANGYGFVSLTTALAVLRATGPRPTVIRTIPLASALGEALTHNQKYLLVTGQHGLTVFSVSDLEHGLSAPLGILASPGQHPIQVAVSRDDRFAFVTLQYSGRVAVYDLQKALTSSFGPADLVGQIRVGANPIGVTTSPDGRYLYVASGLATPTRNSGKGLLSVISVRKAETNSTSSVLKQVSAGCGPDRVALSANGRTVWVSVGGGNAVVAFSAAKLLSDSRHALIARVAVGQLPLGLAIANGGSRLIVADSNRDGVRGGASSLAVIDVQRALARQPALAGFLRAGSTPRNLAVEPGGGALLVVDTGSGQVQADAIARLP
ncbi:MAG TPA: protein kinase [Streptosporangiaceae bacterium]|nr:protein kinase [Streptosporangiaceae bacterium]